MGKAQRIVPMAVAVVLALVALIVGAAPSTAHHGRSQITNSVHSVANVATDTYCLNGYLSNTPWWLSPGSTASYYDKGWKVPAGYQYDAIRNGSTWRNNYPSDGKAVCVGGSDVWVIVVTRKL